MSSPADLRAWITLLEREDELVRAAAELDPDLEITRSRDHACRDLQERRQRVGLARVQQAGPDERQSSASPPPFQADLNGLERNIE